MLDLEVLECLCLNTRAQALSAVDEGQFGGFRRGPEAGGAGPLALALGALLALS